MSCAWLYIQYQTTVIWSLLRSTGVCSSVPGIQVASLLVQEHYCSGTPIKYADNFLTENGPKTAEGSSTPFKRELGPHLTQCCLGHGRGYFAECGLRKVVLSCQGVICGKSSVERSANYPLLLFRIPQPKNCAFPRIAKLPFARIAQQMCNRCIPSRGPLKNKKNEKWFIGYSSSMLDCTSNKTLKQEHTVQNYNTAVTHNIQ